MISRPAKDAYSDRIADGMGRPMMDCNPKLQIHGNSMTGMVEGL